MVGGCLPSSQKQNTQTLTPGDSLSREIAATALVDSLTVVWEVRAPEETPMELPTSLVWFPDSLGGDLVVADTRRGYIHRISPDGAYQGVWESDDFQFPYLAGIRGDSIAVFNRGRNTLGFVRNGSVVRSITLPEEDVSAVLVTDSSIVVKRTEEGIYDLAEISEHGEMLQRYELVGPYWRHYGFIRSAGSQVFSLSGYRPVVDVLQEETPAGSTLDTLALVGFDSPQLVRSNQFLLDEIDEPPLLISSATYHAGKLYVVNMRAERVRIDVYGTGGHLERVLEYVDYTAVSEAFPADIAVRSDGSNGLLIALVMQSPGGIFSRPGGYVLMLKTAG